MPFSAIKRRLRDDLRGLFRGEIRLDDPSVTVYSTDASLFRVPPTGVAIPRDEDDLRTLLKYASENGLAILPRGGGSGLAGECLGTGLVVDCSVHLRQILQTGSDFVRVQPGVVLRNLNAHLAARGRKFAPQPASAAQCTLGGMLATNASGGGVARLGYTRDHVLSARVVWDTGEAASIAPVMSLEGVPRTLEILAGVGELLRDHADVLTASRRQFPFDRCGYTLDEVLTRDGLNLLKLLIGSEGTLGIFSEATLKTIPLPGGESAVLFAMENLDAALKAAERLRPSLPLSADLLDRRLLSLVRSGTPEVARWISPAAGALLFVEYEADSPEQARQAIVDAIERVQKNHRVAISILPAFEPDTIASLRQVRDSAIHGIFGLPRGPQPLPFIEDSAVPPEVLPEFLAKLQDLLRDFDTTASFLLHTTTGMVQTRPLIDPEKPEESNKLWAIAEQVHSLAISLGGTISSRHGIGIARTPWVEKQVGSRYPIFRELKRIFDPHHILNPGKIVGPDPSRPAWSLRPPLVKEPESLNLRWKPGEVLEQISSCNGCGACRTETPTKRMCPIFRVDHTEKASPRAKATLLRQIYSPEGDPTQLGADEIRQVADLCVNCRMCASECPAHVDIPKLMLETKAAHTLAHGLDRSDWVMARIETFATVGGNFALVTNGILGSRAIRWGLEKIFGVSRRRRLPDFAPRNFLKRARRKGWSERGIRRVTGVRRIAYFVDIFANYNDPLIGEATVRVLKHHGFEVYVPPKQRGCGMAPLAVGDLETAREEVRHNLRIFGELVREGYTIVCSEPTAALMLQRDVPDLIDDPDAIQVAEHTIELTTFLRNELRQSRLRTDFKPLPISLGHHVPCHMKALNVGIYAPELLRLIPELKVHTIDVSCSGMAGTYGLKAKNYETSLQAGRPMLEELSKPKYLFGSTECSTCRMQMEEGTRKRTLHPIQYLALSYGLLPEIADLLRKPIH